MSALRHYIWSAINRVGVQLIGFVGNILIARQLAPDDYGLVAMLTIFLGIAWNLTESGFADYLIVKHGADKLDFSTIFMYNMCVSIFLYLLLYFTAPAISGFYGRPELTEIARVIGLSIVLKAFTLTEFTRMRKELQFRNSALIQLISSVTSVIVAYSLALNGFGYWAIVSQTIVIAVMNLLMILVMNGWRFSFRFDLTRYKEMRGFSNNMLVSYFTNQIGQNTYSVFIGKFHSTVLLGFYNQATKINDACFQGINAIILTTSYPILAREKDREVRKTMYLKVLHHFLFIQFFLCFFTIGAAYPIMEILFGKKWLPTAPYLQLLTLALLFDPLITLNGNIAKVEVKSRLYRNLTFLRNGLNFLAILLTFWMSLEMILLGQLVARYISIITDVIVCSKLVSFRPIQQFSAVFEQILAPVVGMLAAYFASFYVMQPHLKLGVYVSVYFFIFYATNKMMKNLTQQYYLDKILTLLRKGAR